MESKYIANMDHLWTANMNNTDLYRHKQKIKHVPWRQAPVAFRNNVCNNNKLNIGCR